MRSDENYSHTDDKTRKYNFKLWIFMFGIFLLPLSPYLNNQCNVQMSLNNIWCVITGLTVKLFKFETIKVEKSWAHIRVFYHVMTVDRCAEVGSPWSPWPCDFTLDGSPVRSGPGKEAARPETATRPGASLPFPRAPDPLSARPLHSRPRRYLFYGPLTFTAAKITLRLQTTTVLGRHYKIISSCIFWTSNLQLFWKLNQNCYLLQLLF